MTTSKPGRATASKASDKAKKGQSSSEARTPSSPASREALHQVIAVAAYYRAERRNFEPGHEMEDWLDAEAEVLATTAAKTRLKSSAR